MIESSYFLNVGDKVLCMRCTNLFTLEVEPMKCCKNKLDAFYNLCGCQGIPEPIFCGECWKELEQ